jgi:uncharacterized protein YxjI
MSNTNPLLEADKIMLKKRIFSISEHYDFETPEGIKLGEADANLIQLPAKISVQDHSGVEIMKIEGKIISLRPEYTIHDPTGSELGTITKKMIKLIGNEFWIKKNNIEFMRIYGDFTEHEYKMTIKGDQVATVHRKWISLRDQLEITITGETDHRIILGAVIVIEHISYTERQNKAQLAKTASDKAKHTREKNPKPPNQINGA